MSSSQALATCELLARGIKYKDGSAEDTFSRLALERERKSQFLATLAIINAIIETGNRIVAAVTQSPGQQGSVLKKTIETLRAQLVPEEAEDTEQDALEARKKLEDELRKGPIEFRAINSKKRRKR